MSPLSAIPSALPVQDILPQARIAPAELLPQLNPAEVKPAAAGESFGTLLGRMVQEVNARQDAASEAVNALHSGGNVSLHQAVIAIEEASISFQLMVEVRNKLLESYQELMRMQL